MSPLFSVILPTLNSARTIDVCLASLLSQTLDDLEVIVVDGVSSDDTAERVAAWARSDPRVRWFSGKDRGIYDAMNRGMSLARGRWLYFIGSDDVLASADVFERVAAQASNHRVLYGSVQIVGDAPWAAHGSLYDGRFSVRKLLTRNICHQAMFYRRDFVEQSIGIYAIEFPVCADWDFNLRCRAKTRFHFLNLTIAIFQTGGQSTENAYDAAFTEGFVERSLGYLGMSPVHPVSLAAFSRRKRELLGYWWRTLKAKTAFLDARR
jgi:glycosyltransferase involved in cell wall biosynthesis